MQKNNYWVKAGRLSNRIVDMLWEDELVPEAAVEVPVDLPVEKLHRLAGIYAFENVPGEMIAPALFL